MRTLKKIRDEVAKNAAFDDWEDLCFCYGEMASIYRFEELTGHVDNVCMLAQKEALQNAQEVFLNNDVGDTLDNELILSENNIVK